MIPYQAFDTVAVHRGGLITLDELELFMDRNEIAISRKMLEFLFYALKRRHY
jgi:hypothetical protein